jgi:hypothetical protein
MVERLGISQIGELDENNSASLGRTFECGCCAAPCNKFTPVFLDNWRRGGHVLFE